MGTVRLCGAALLRLVPAAAARGGTLAGGILFPLAGFNNLNVAEGEDGSGSFAWTVQTNLHITF